MKTIKILSLFIFILLVSGCKKEGCTDHVADNYNSAAKKNDGSCKYSGDLVVNVRDEVGNSITGEWVSLYRTNSDMQSGNNIEEKITDNSGQVKFAKLPAGVYYFDCIYYDDYYGDYVIAEGSATVSNGMITTTDIFGEP